MANITQHSTTQPEWCMLILDWISFIRTHGQANADFCRNDVDINVFWMEYLQAGHLQWASKVQLLQSAVSVHLSYTEEKCHTTMWYYHSCRFRNAFYWFWQHNITLAVHADATNGSDSIKIRSVQIFDCRNIQRTYE